MTTKLANRLGSELSELNPVLLSSKEELRQAMNRDNSDKLLINTLKLKFQKIIFQILAISSSRHQTMWSDVESLNSLEYKYIANWDEINLTKARNIIISEDYIEIAGIKLKRKDEFDKIWLCSWITVTQDWKNMLFTYESALRYLHFKKGFIIPVNKDWENMIDSIPCWKDENKAENMKEILNLKFAGFYSWRKPWLEEVQSNVSYWQDMFWIYWSWDSKVNEIELSLFIDSILNKVTPLKILQSSLSLRCKVA